MKSFSSQCATEEDVVDLFKIILGREVSISDKFVQSTVASKKTFENLIPLFLGSEEFKQNFERAGNNFSTPSELKNWQELRNPKSLHLTPCSAKKALLVGSCLLEYWSNVIRRVRDIDIDYINTNNGSTLPDKTASEVSQYQFQIVQISIRSVFPEGLYMGLRYDDNEGWHNAFNYACRTLDRIITANTEYNRKHGLLTFVMNFVLPQQNYAGKLIAKYHLANPEFFFSELNRYLDTRVREQTNMYVVDFDQICANFGRHWVGEDRVTHYNHGGILSPMKIDAGTPRIVQEANVSALAPIKSDAIIQTAFDEVLELNRIIRQQDSIKIVIFDLDDTLWKGIAAESDGPTDPIVTEGWPLGLIEAISFLWRRGILVAICSKNDQAIAENAWNELYGKKFPIENFAIRKINWESKSRNIAEILEAVNLLPGNALFVDDNPAERAKVKSEFPEIRLLDGPLLDWRHTLLWAAELQQSSISAESISRTDTIKAKIERSLDASQMSAQDHLYSLEVAIEPKIIQSIEHPSFSRALELLNKTNQFNSTGRRWSVSEMSAFMSDGGRMIALQVEDKHASYGLTAVALVIGVCIEQIVMSCRIFGMGVENALSAIAIQEIKATTLCEQVTARLIDTGKNKLTHGFFANSGFTEHEASIWSTNISELPIERYEVPQHIRVKNEAAGK